jgi:hypothetical protein
MVFGIPMVLYTDNGSQDDDENTALHFASYRLHWFLFYAHLSIIAPTPTPSLCLDLLASPVHKDNFAW